MIEKILTSHDGITLNCAASDTKPGNPWIALILPFGLKLNLAKHFIEFFEPQYNVVVWETRSILEDTDRSVSSGEFSMANHIKDIRTVLDTCATKKFIVVGYCSGAGLALALANRHPDIIEDLVLVHGEYALLNEASCTTQFAQEIDSLLSLAGRDESLLKSVFEKIKDERIDQENTNRPDGIDMPFTKLFYLRRHAANYLSYKETDFQKLAKYVSHKTLLMSGERDTQVNTESTKRIANLMPSSSVYIDPDADHYGILRKESKTLVNIWNYLCG